MSSPEELHKRKAEIINFLDKEYSALREEIKASKERGFKILFSGLIGTPAIAGLAEKLSWHQVFYVLPFVVIALLLTYLAENQAVFRAGCFIRKQIEPAYKEICGWENWLSCPHKAIDSRNVDKNSIRAFSLLFFIYYWLAACYALVEGEAGGFLFFALVILYAALGIALGIWSYRNVRTDTYANPCRITDCPPQKYLSKLSGMQGLKEDQRPGFRGIMVSIRARELPRD